VLTNEKASSKRDSSCEDGDASPARLQDSSPQQESSEPESSEEIARVLAILVALDLKKDPPDNE
jgi:hypothetical protein